MTVIRIPSRLRIVIPSRRIEGRLLIEIDTTPLLPNPAFMKTEAIFCAVSFIIDFLLGKDRF
jgi:hypothetical protein